jgi:class 3 adenylate cyclase
VRQPKVKPLILAIRDAVEIGRDCDGLLLSDPEVSRRHVVLRLDDDALVVEDLGSTNGTTVNGTKIEAPFPLSEADVVCLGRTELRLLPDVGRGRPHRKPMPMSGATTGPRGTTVAAGGGEAVVRGKADASGARMTSIDAVADAVDEERAKVASLAAAGGTITIVFSDIESSTEMAMSLGDTKWFEVLGEHNDIIRRNLDRYDGTVIKSQGDGFMLTFPSARAAMLCMIDVQRDLAKREREVPDAPIRIRIGLHTGEAIVDSEGDLFGKHIIMAARIANLAEGGQILVSSITKEITSSRGDLQFGTAREVTLKGIEGEYQVHEVVWDRPDDTEASPPAP